MLISAVKLCKHLYYTDHIHHNWIIEPRKQSKAAAVFLSFGVSITAIVMAPYWITWMLGETYLDYASDFCGIIVIIICYLMLKTKEHRTE